jgi:hypothetical protein
MFRHTCQKLFFSDELFQAQLQAQRWASEDIVSVKMLMESDSSAADLSQVAMVNPPIVTNSMMTSNMNGHGVIASRTNDFFQSPPSTTETESSVEQQRRGNINVNGGPVETTGREYKHWHFPNNVENPRNIF